ncbi:MAG TPA: hypothetical protein VE989_10185 [Sphingomicrobium sp.]|nr:hypothetical protein [Sphingomicrobium sp.]
MEARHVQRLESAVDGIAAAVLAVAAGYCGLATGLPPLAATASAVLILLAGWKILGAVAAGPQTFLLPAFDPAPLPAAEPAEELILTDSDRLDHSQVADELVLDDVLARLEDFSRVVRLFDRSAMPTPDELKSRIDRHLETPASAPPDASQALHDALSQLRRTLR